MNLMLTTMREFVEHVVRHRPNKGCDVWTDSVSDAGRNTVGTRYTRIFGAPKNTSVIKPTDSVNTARKILIILFG
jgi:hypothetical protein